MRWRDEVIDSVGVVGGKISSGFKEDGCLRVVRVKVLRIVGKDLLMDEKEPRLRGKLGILG